jgi:peroxiredoxin Q/BCP
MSRSSKALIGALAAALVACAIALASCGPARRPDGGVGLLPIGAPAPDLEGHDGEDRPVRLSGLRGKRAVVYFYPKDGTPGCTKEACAFRDAWDRYQRAGVVILGVSRDSAESHKEFAKHHELPFPLVADEDGAIARAYGVSSFLGMSSRVSFLVSKDGRIARVWPDVDPGTHADQVLAAAAAP